MATFVDPKRTIDYILKADRALPKEEQTIFKLRLLTARQWEERKDLVTGTEDNGQAAFKTGTWVLYTLRRGLTGWEGRVPAPFEVHPREPNFPTDETLTRLQPADRVELANAIDAMVTVDPALVKN